MNAVTGSSSADEPASFAPGAHDPNRDESLQLQSLEPSVSLRWGDYVRGFATGSAFTDEDDDFDWEWEEYFLSLHNLPGGLELRGGRFMNRVGLHNATHLHGWETVDMPLPHALLLGSEGLQTDGGELNFHLDTSWPTVLSISYGKRPSHDHDHGHDDEEDEDDHGHDDHDDHGHGSYGGFEEFQAAEDLVTLGLRSQLRLNDFKSWTFATAAGKGNNELEGDAWFALAGVEYNWRENGFEPGGRELVWRTEAIRFLGKTAQADDEDHDEHDEHDDDDEEDHDDHEDEEEHGSSASVWGFSTQLAYQASERLRPFGRVDYVRSVPGLDLASWTRYSVGMSISVLEFPHTTVRLQGNFDERGDESEQSVWLQLAISLGGSEVR